MDHQQLLALVAFAFVSTVSPGPNNVMLMTSGAKVGFMRTIPHMSGIVLGFSLMVFLVGIGLMKIFALYPITQQILQISCIGYLLYLAWKIALSQSTGNSASDYKPMSFWAAVYFQWINPKAWSMALTAISVYNASTNVYGVLFVSLVFALINIPSVSIWTIAGKTLSAALNNESKMKAFNYAMALLLLASTLMMLEI
ncbi:LysE family translocator [Ferrimonas kyonanensis]|uniref:LysE family translocator n=1 Tax=Ferrimonas kyonanensis TaxID=364763 RepID=UPI000483EB93|nr:LysE family translocator [Ferrimonas kyonanensis]